MKKHWIGKIWGLSCILVVILLMLCTSFQFLIECDSEQFETFHSKIENGKTYEMSEFCELFEIEYTSDPTKYFLFEEAKELETYGVGADERYTTVSYMFDMLERIFDNVRFDASIFFLPVFKNFLIYLLCFLLAMIGLVMLATALVNNIKVLYKALIKKGNNVEERSTDTYAFYGPLLFWISIFIFSFYNSASLSNVYDVENSISTSFLQGCNYLFVFFGGMAIYYLGKVIISVAFRKKADGEDV